MPPSRRRQESTQSNRILQNPTETRVCAHEAQRSRRVQEHSVPPNRQSPIDNSPDRNRHNATELNEAQRKLVPARARGTAFPTGTRALNAPQSTILPLPRRIPHPTPSFPTHPRHIPHPPTSFPRRREPLLPARIAPKSQADSTYRSESPSPNRHADNRTKPNRRRAPKPPWPAILYPGNARGVPQHF